MASPYHQPPQRARTINPTSPPCANPKAPLPTLSLTPAPSPIPSYLTSPLRRLRWLHARILSERHEPRSLPLSYLSLTPHPSSPTSPPSSSTDDDEEWRARSYREILSRKRVAAQHAGAHAVSQPLADLLERAAEHACLLAWWACSRAWYAAAREVCPDGWWWGGGPCAGWAEVLVSRGGVEVGLGSCEKGGRKWDAAREGGGREERDARNHPCLRRVGGLVGRGDAVIVSAARRKGGAAEKAGVVSGRLDDLVELTGVLCGISWCFMCFYLWAVRARVWAYPRAAWRALGRDGQRCRLDIELLEL
ncbi:hypothetical protein F4810DRAFT_659153, partial [Camillea tinctor]